ncbi:MAG: hypothetical protein V4760_10120 [Bdellovibrionota bacterium]
MTRKQKLKVFVPLAVLGLFLTSYLGVAGYAKLVWSHHHAPKVEAYKASVEKHFPAIQADLELLDADPIFESWSLEKNAEPYLTKYISWGGSTQKPSWDNHAQLLAIVERHKKGLKDLSNWNEFAADPDVLSLDVSWVDELKTFDHWSFKSNPDYVQILKIGPTRNSIDRIGMWATSPVPEMQELRYALLARLVQLSLHGELRKGFENFRHGAHLMHSTSTLIGEMMAVTLIGQERVLAERTGLRDWKTVDEARAKAYKRLAWGWGGVMTVFHWKPEVMAQFEKYAKPQNAICGGALESILTGSIWGDFLEARVPLEADFEQNVLNARAVTATFLDRCGLPEYKPLLGASPPGANPLWAPKFTGTWDMIDEGSFRLPLNPSRVPFVRRMVGLELMTIAMPGWMRQYEDRVPADASSSEAGR